jgi:flagellar basal body-associated protein FliL
MATQSKQAKSRITPINLIVAALVILAGAGVYAWWQFSYTNPSKVFNRMVANNLATPSMTKKTNQVSEGQSLDQTSILVTSPKPYVVSQATLNQKQGVETTKVVTESLAFPTEEYTRYLNISTTQKAANGKPYNFSKLFGVWGKTTQQDAESGGPQTYSQTILGIIPVGTMTAAQRQDLTSYIQKNNVFGVDGNKVTKVWKNNRLVYTYQGSVRPIPYVTMLKVFAHSMGLRQLDGISPEQYKDSPPIAFTLDVDVISGQMTALKYTDSGRVDQFMAYGYRPVVKIPQNTIPISELQSRLQQIN